MQAQELHSIRGFRALQGWKFLRAFCFLLIGVLFSNLTVEAAELIPVPALTGPVVDQVGVIGNSEKRRLENLSYSLRDDDQIYFQVLIINSLGEETIEQFSIRVTDQWKLGEKNSDRGVLLVVAIQNKKVRIEVGRGLEGILTDLISKRIIREEATPYFRRGDFGGGVIAMQVRIAGILRKSLHGADGASDVSSESEPNRDSDAGVDPETGKNRDQDKGAQQKHDLLVIIVLLGLIFLLNRFGGGGGRRGLRQWGGGWYGGGGGWSGGGGSSWSGGGGGGFSGGGASGDW